VTYGDSFKYDPFGRRIYKSSANGTSIYAYDGDNLVEETNSSGAAVARYSQGLNIDEPLAMLRSSATSFYDADGLGTITSLTNTVGALAETYTFDSFGKQTASSGSLTNPFQYTGREFDPETSLYYYRARYYDPSTGRFLSEDPTGSDGGADFYRYVHNHPTTLSDPMGLSPADVQRFKDACKKCTQGLTDMGYRQPGTGTWRGFRNDNQVLLGILKGLLLHGDPHDSGKLQGCKSQADLVKKTCLDGDPTLRAWKISEVPWWLGSHTIVLGESPDPSDPLVYCDPWRNETRTAPRNPPDVWPRYAKF
jgi:RHS repeat-associated protein